VYSPIYVATTILLVGHHDFIYFASEKAHLTWDGDGKVIGNVLNWTDERELGEFEAYTKYCEVDHKGYDILPLTMFCAQNSGLRVKRSSEACSCNSILGNVSDWEWHNTKDCLCHQLA
jgi:hypothetical protein